MARFTSAHQFVDGCRPLDQDTLDDLPAVPGFRPSAEPRGHGGGGEVAPASLLRRHRGLVSTLVGAGVAAGLLGLLVHDVYAPRPPADFSCPPAVSDAVQVATGCRIEPGPDDEE